MKPNDTIELCRVEYDRLVAALNENKDLKKEVLEVYRERDEVAAERDAVATDRDKILKERKEVGEAFLQKCDKVNEQEKELLWLRGFYEAIKIIGGAQKPY